MAAVARDRRADERIDAFLAYCIREWEVLPEVAGEWAKWGQLERLAFVLEWPIREDRLAQVRQRAAQGRLTPMQGERFAHLLGLVAQHRSTLEMLLESGVE